MYRSIHSCKQDFTKIVSGKVDWSLNTNSGGLLDEARMGGLGWLCPYQPNPFFQGKWKVKKVWAQWSSPIMVKHQRNFGNLSQELIFSKSNIKSHQVKGLAKMSKNFIFNGRYAFLEMVFDNWYLINGI